MQKEGHLWKGLRVACPKNTLQEIPPPSLCSAQQRCPYKTAAIVSAAQDHAQVRLDGGRPADCCRHSSGTCRASHHHAHPGHVDIAVVTTQTAPNSTQILTCIRWRARVGRWRSCARVRPPRPTPASTGWTWRQEAYVTCEKRRLGGLIIGTPYNHCRHLCCCDSCTIPGARGGPSTLPWLVRVGEEQVA